MNSTSPTLFDSPMAPPRANEGIPNPGLCPSDLPLVLLPVRLETRFFPLTATTTELRIRVYPDQVHLDTHEPQLTAEERDWGTRYWQADWAAAANLDARRDAWRTLADRFGAPRAAWIVRALQPTNLAQRPAASPVFPNLTEPAPQHRWNRAPQARLLPDRWIAIVHSAGQVAQIATGADIPRPLAVGPDPQAPPPDEATRAAIDSGEELAIDGAMTWLVDFDEAERVGMALRMSIPTSVANAGLDSLLVFGVVRSLGVAETAAGFADLLDAHHYTDGLAFLPLGTPTNNTDDRRAGYDSADPDRATSFANEMLTDPNRSVNALRAGAALGLSFPRIAGTLGRLDGAARDHDTDLRAMNTALWPAGWGYYLTNMIGAETGLSPDAVDWVRGHFLDYVRAGGPLPALRCGPQPYGILPVTLLDGWTPQPGDQSAARQGWLRDLLVHARDRIWRPVLGSVARIGLRTPPDPDADLADVMRTDGISHGHLARPVLGRHYVQHLYSLNAQSLSADLQAQDVIADKILTLLGLPTQAGHRPHVAGAFHSDSGLPVTAPLVQPDGVAAGLPGHSDYLGALLAATTIDAIVNAAPAPASLLHALLRHGLLREFATAAARIAATIPGSPSLATLLRDLELVDLVDVPPVNFVLATPPQTRHWRRQLDLTDAPLTAGASIRAYLEGLTDFGAAPVASLGQFRAGLAHLRGLDDESLHVLMQSTLDLSSHRLDAWITSFATKRLAQLLPDGPQGQYIGAYGWVENLRPGPVRTPLPASALPPGEPGPLYAPANDSGFLHAPSVNHASTAALLRNAHLGPSGVPSAEGPFAIDLSSRRVRDAENLLDGVRQGQPLGALLGYRLERHLHELQLDRFVAPLRELAPIAVRERSADQPKAEAIAAGNVVDGLMLLRRYDESGPSLLTGALTGASSAELNAVTNELAALADSVDALGDALTAEAAHQLVQGNTARMASTLAAVSQGEALPAELAVTRTPRSGNPVTHRVAVLFSGVSNSGGGWLAYNATPRPLAERWLSAWVRQLLGDARTIRCTVQRLDEATGAVVQTVRFPLNDVPVTALDFVYFTGTDAGGLCYAEQLVLYHARVMTGGFGATAALRLHHVRPQDLSPGETTLFDALEQARAIRTTLSGTRGLLPDDLSPPGRAAGATVDLAELESRIVRLENTLDRFHKALSASAAKSTAATADELRTGLLNLSLLGVGGSVPCVATDDDTATRMALLSQANAVLKESAPRLARATALRAAPAVPDPRARVQQLVDRAHNVCGNELVVLPYFTCDVAGATELGGALAASTQQQGGDRLAAHGWYTRMARVREPLARLGTCLRLADVLSTGARLNLTVAQLPFDARERWVGLPPADGTELAANKLSLVCQSTLPLDAAKALCGLLIDEWVEVVPNKTETTALAFQLDPPNSVPPQNILVAVPPVPGQAWDTETLRRVLMETLDLAKLRAVDPALLGAAAQYLPALYLPFNAADDAVSTDFAPYTG
ncbi:hypothetical protein [Rhizocola hellebori]|nr:hypothetical protein [Rhizocola hellebori]